MKLLILVLVVLLIPLVTAAVLASVQSEAPGAPSANPLNTAPTARTVTDERQLRIVAEAVAGPEVAAGAARGTVTSVAAKAGDALADGAVLFQVDGVDRVGVPD